MTRHQFDHSCQQADNAEAVARNLALFSHLSGANRAAHGWPLSVKVRALRLSGRHVEAADLAAWGRAHAKPAPIVHVPAQRRPHPMEARLVDQARRAHRTTGPTA